MTELDNMALPRQVALGSLNAVLDPVRDGVVLLDRNRCVSFANPAARQQLGMRTSGPLPASAVPFVPPWSSDAVEIKLDIAGEPYTAVILRDLTAADPDQRRLVAFARTAARAACAGSLQSALDSLAAEVLDVTAAVTCAVMVADPKTGAMSLVGAAGHPADYVAKVEEARRRGAPLRALAVMEQRRPRVERNLRALVRDDDRFAPLAPIVAERGWTSMVTAPLVMREVSLGALTAFYSAPADPDEAEVAFLAAMADQAAVAVNTAVLFAEAEAKAVVEERNRLARDLHDSVTQTLYSIVLQTRAAQAAAGRMDDAAGAMIAGRLGTLCTLAEGALADMRSAIMQLRGPASAGESGLAAAVREHAAAVAEREGIAVRVSVPEEPLLLSVRAEDELFRVIAEALTNSVHHAQATVVEIAMTGPDGRDELLVTITDNGIGFDPARGRPGHVGLDSMRERAERLGGRLTIESSRHGTTVCAVVPCRRWPSRTLDHG
jgi:signal transduction histidine kinase